MLQKATLKSQRSAGVTGKSACAMETCCRSPPVVSSLPGRLQSHDGFLPVLRHGQLLLAPGGGVVSSHPVGHLLLLREEVLLVVHLDWLG